MPELHQRSLDTQVVTCDVTKDSDLCALVDAALSRFGRIDVLINNAGFGQFGGIETVTPVEARAQLEVNTIAPMRLAQLVLPHMRRQGGGLILNVSSVAGRVVLPWGGWYSASKFALEALTDALRLECRPFNVKVVSVLAGPTSSAFVKNVKLCAPSAESPEILHKIHQHAQEHRAKPRRSEWTHDRMAELLLKITASPNPKPRYVTTLTGKTAVALRKVLPDRLWDRFIVRAYGAQHLLKTPSA